MHYLSCGKNHSGMIIDSFETFMWGSNKHGQLGIGSEDLKILMPQKINLGKKATKLALGFKNSLILTSEFNVYACGANENQEVSE